MARGATHLVLFGCLLWHGYGAPRLYRLETLASARDSLETLGRLEELHRQSHGGYTDRLDRLASLTPSTEEFYGAIALSFDTEKGVGIHLDPDGKGYVLTAHARDRRRTPLRIVGPVRP